MSEPKVARALAAVSAVHRPLAASPKAGRSAKLGQLNQLSILCHGELKRTNRLCTLVFSLWVFQSDFLS
jgi:hypothetical protein